uniref:Tensin-like C1 domain-containing phosphatase n=1 Tax=Bactrocera latifrons TaxID=174628 RepID=A0A0K8VZN2_BACLA
MNDNVKAIRIPLEICTKATDIYKSAYMKQNFNLELDDSVDIPYHARETALPFTYGDISEGLTQSQLKHVESIFNKAQFENDKQPFLKETNSLYNLGETAMIQDVYLKKKIVNKEKLQQSSVNLINKNKQIGKRGLLSENKLNNNIVRSGNYTRKLSENVHNRIILEQNEISNELLNTSHNDLNFNRWNSKDQPITETKDLKRCQTPSFPCEEFANFSNRSISSSPTFSPQICSTNVKNKKEYKIVTENITNTNTNFAKFAKDTSNFWYKPHITREEALIILGNAKPGSFILRNSTTYKNSFGLVLRVSRPPVNLAVVTDNSELVRHYLLERTTCGINWHCHVN